MSANTPASRLTTAPPPAAARLRDVASSPVREILALTQRPGVISFAGGLPAPELFDAPGLREAFAAALADDRCGATLQYSTTEGDPQLRAAIADRLGRRGLPTEPDDVLVTSGSQQALDARGRRPARARRRRAGRGALLPGGAAGVPAGRRPRGPGALRRRRPGPRRAGRAACAAHRPEAPLHGPDLPEPDRPHAAARAPRRARRRPPRSTGLWIVEDDPYGELRYRGEPSRPRVAPGAEDRTIALRRCPRSSSPGLRIGWLRAPAALRRALVVAKQAADLHTSTIDQAAAARWLADVRPRRPRRRACAPSTARAATRCSARSPSTLPAGRRAGRAPTAACSCGSRLPDGWDADALLAAALEREVAFVPGCPFFAGPPDRATLRFSFTTHTPVEIAEGLARLRAAVDRRG